jgi:hypothetical protein
MSARRSLVASTLLALACASTAVLAQDHGHEGRGGGPEHGVPDRGGPGDHSLDAGRGRPGVDLDHRYNHDRYYPSRGYVYGALPHGAISVGYHGGNYFFHGGVWFRPWGGRYEVVTPPLGIFLPILPPDYVTLWMGGVPYYYADGVYYNQAPGQGYVVVAPPPGAETAQPAPPPTPAAPDPIFYPRNHQTADQTEADRRECNSWATGQPNAMNDAKVFQRSVDACMDAHGYTVR